MHSRKPDARCLRPRTASRPHALSLLSLPSRIRRRNVHSPYARKRRTGGFSCRDGRSALCVAPCGRCRLRGGLVVKEGLKHGVRCGSGTRTTQLALGASRLEVPNRQYSQSPPQRYPVRLRTHGRCRCRCPGWVRYYGRSHRSCPTQRSVATPDTQPCRRTGQRCAG